MWRADNFVRDRARIVARANKPFVLEEYGMPVRAPLCSSCARALVPSCTAASPMVLEQFGVQSGATSLHVDKRAL